MRKGKRDFGRPSNVNTCAPHLSVGCPSSVKVAAPQVSIVAPLKCQYRQGLFNRLIPGLCG
ncbi:hypothetical protein GAW19_21850 [Salmonella enterica subsp. enterica serovar Enteritidis]|nr:hypothetical protein [Salmonella enterica subsp. enterica serovar Enteritidis]